MQSTMFSAGGRFTVGADGHSGWKGSSGAVGRQDVLAGVSTVGEYTGELSRDDVVPTKPVAAMSYGQRVRISRLWNGHEEFLGQVIRVAGWAKSTRAQSNTFCFVELNDGSCFKNVQVVVD